MEYVIELTPDQSVSDSCIPARPNGGVVAIVPVGPNVTEHQLAAIWRCLGMQTRRPDLVVFSFDRNDLMIPDIPACHGVRWTTVRCRKQWQGTPGRVRNAGLIAYLAGVHRGDYPLAWAIFSPDADDIIPPDYVEKCWNALASDVRNGVAYGTIYELRGDSHSIVQDKEDLGRENWIQSGCMYRFEALMQAGGWHQDSLLDDWMTLRRIRDLGWRFVKADTAYYWCPGDDGAHAQAVFKSSRPWSSNVWHAERLITVAIPVVRPEGLQSILDTIADMEMPGVRNSVLVYDNTADVEGQTRIAGMVAEFSTDPRVIDKIGEVRLFRDDRRAIMSGKVSNREVAEKRMAYSMAANYRVGGAWNTIFQIADTDFVFCVEDDIKLNTDTLVRLFSRMSVDVDGVSAAYRDRSGAWCAWHAHDSSFEMIKAAGTGCQQVSGFGLGCAIIRRRAVCQIPFQGDGPGYFSAYDIGRWSIHARAGGLRLLVDWDTVVGHEAVSRQARRPQNGRLRRAR